MHAIPLPGIDGGHPLGFLAALGSLRTACSLFPDAEPSLAWKLAGAWQPILGLPDPLSEEDLCERFAEQLGAMRNHPGLGDGGATALGDDLTVSVATYRRFAEAAAAAASQSDRTWADLATAFGTDGVGSAEGKIEDTAFRTMSGAGHQHFLRSIRELVCLTTSDDLRRALFQQWAYEDDRPTLRWDPEDDRRYAYRWSDPSSSSRSPIRTVRGANRLAVEALPFFPTLPGSRRAVTVGFGRPTRGRVPWRWPIWQPPCNADVVRCLLSLPGLHGEPNPRDQLAAMGIVEVYETNRITVGKFRNFTPARAV